MLATIWGIIATLTGLAQGFGSLIACRLLLGIAESGLFPGLILYLTVFYTKRELAGRIAFLAIGSSLGGAFGGLIAYSVGSLDGAAGLRAWRW